MSNRPAVTQGQVLYKQVLVNSIEPGNVALVTDQFGRSMQIPTNVLRAKGQFPEVGETWIIDYALGQWTFAAILNAQPLVVTGGGGGSNQSYQQDRFTVPFNLPKAYQLTQNPIIGSETIALNGIGLDGTNGLDYSIANSVLTLTSNVLIVQSDVISAAYAYVPVTS